MDRALVRRSPRGFSRFRKGEGHVPRSIVITAFMTVLAVQPALGQERTHRWQDGMCDYTVRFDARRVDPGAVASTAELLSSEQGGVPIAPYVESPNGLARLDPSAFEAECAAKAARVRGHALLPLDGLPAFRDAMALQFDDACLFGGVKLRGYTNPSVLRRYVRASPHCDVYVDALEGKTDLTALWRKRVRDNCANNASPAACRQRHEAQGDGPNGEVWKRLYLIGFGWGNCALDHMTSNGAEGKRSDAQRPRLLKAFVKAYRVKESCEEP